MGILPAQRVALRRNVSSIVEDFKPTIAVGSGVQAIAGLLWTHFTTLYQQHIAQSPAEAVPDGQTVLTFVVAGYDPGSREGALFSLDIPSAAAPTTASRSTNNPGPWWIGQTNVVARIINGYDYSALSLPFVQGANQAGTVAADQLKGLSYIVSCNIMTQQDAIDFAVGMIQITITTQRFTAGIVNQLGAIAGVGGPIDVAVVRPGTNVSWVHRKELHI
jgi:hypothetical protein